MFILRGIYPFVFLLCYSFIVWGQPKPSPDCIYLQKAYTNFCNHNYIKTIKILTKFRKEFPHHPLVEEAHYTIGLAYFESGNYEKSNRVFWEIINKKDYPYPDSVFSTSGCFSRQSKCALILEPDFSLNIQHEACIKLAETGFLKKDYSLTFTGILNADKYYRYWYGCGTGDQEENMRLALLYSRYFYETGKKDSAILVLLSHCLEPAALAMRYYQDIFSRALILLNEKYNAAELRKKFDESIRNMEVEVHKSDDMHINYTYFIRFMDVKIPVAPAYLFGKTNDMEEVKKYVRSLDFYRNITPDYNPSPDK
jgi:hypothetical protein